MTPTQLNKLIKAGEVFWLPDPTHPFLDRQVFKAKSVGGLKGIVKVKTARGWLPAEWIRRASSLGLGFKGYTYRVGKQAAGRKLDGRTWDEYPD